MMSPVFLWLIFIARGIFYISYLPLWEGFDEWAHYAVVQNIATTGRLLPSATDKVSREVQASLELTPMPWQVPGLKHDDYWRLAEAERQSREEKLRSIPAQWAREAGTERSYEAQQAPLYYWLLTPAYWLTARLSLPTRVWLLRLLSLLIASAVIPLSVRVISKVLPGAVGATALIAAMPELMMTAGHIANDSLAIALGSLFLLLLIEWKRPIAIGLTLGLALLTKAYFLALIPPLLVLAAMRANRKQAAAIFLPATLISGWWYGRNWVLTHSLSGNQFEVAAQGGLLHSVTQVNWLHAADFTFLSHIWLGNWSFLVVRSWMYHVFAILAAIILAGLIVRLIRRPSSDLWLLSAICLSFVMALAYHAARAFQVQGFAGALGFYLFPIVIAEAILAVAAFRAMAPAGVVCFAALDVFGLCFYSIPYYTGFIAHLPNGAIPTLSIGQLQNGGLRLVLERLAVNKAPFLTPAVMAVLWILFLAATLILVLDTLLYFYHHRNIE